MCKEYVEISLILSSLYVEISFKSAAKYHNEDIDNDEVRLPKVLTVGLLQLSQIPYNVHSGTNH